MKPRTNDDTGTQVQRSACRRGGMLLTAITSALHDELQLLLLCRRVFHHGGLGEYTSQVTQPSQCHLGVAGIE